MDYTYGNIKEYHPNKNRKILVVFGDMIANMLNNKKLNPIVTVLFIRIRKLNIFLFFIIQSFFFLSCKIIDKIQHNISL